MSDTPHSASLSSVVAPVSPTWRLLPLRRKLGFIFSTSIAAFCGFLVQTPWYPWLTAPRPDEVLGRGRSMYFEEASGDVMLKAPYDIFFRIEPGSETGLVRYRINVEKLGKAILFFNTNAATDRGEALWLEDGQRPDRVTFERGAIATRRPCPAVWSNGHPIEVHSFGRHWVVRYGDAGECPPVEASHDGGYTGIRALQGLVHVQTVEAGGKRILPDAGIVESTFLFSGKIPAIQGLMTSTAIFMVLPAFPLIYRRKWLRRITLASGMAAAVPAVSAPAAVAAASLSLLAATVSVFQRVAPLYRAARQRGRLLSDRWINIVRRLFLYAPLIVFMPLCALLIIGVIVDEKPFIAILFLSVAILLTIFAPGRSWRGPARWLAHLPVVMLVTLTIAVIVIGVRIEPWVLIALLPLPWLLRKRRWEIAIWNAWLPTLVVALGPHYYADAPHLIPPPPTKPSDILVPVHLAGSADPEQHPLFAAPATWMPPGDHLWGKSVLAIAERNIVVAFMQSVKTEQAPFDYPTAIAIEFDPEPRTAHWKIHNYMRMGAYDRTNDLLWVTSVVANRLDLLSLPDLQTRSSLNVTRPFLIRNGGNSAHGERMLVVREFGPLLTIPVSSPASGIITTDSTPRVGLLGMNSFFGNDGALWISGVRAGWPIARWDIASGRVTEPFIPTPVALASAPLPAGEGLVIVDALFGLLHRYEGRSAGYRRSRTVTLPAGGSRILHDPHRGVYYVGYYYQRYLSVLDELSMKEVARIPHPSATRDIAFGLGEDELLTAAAGGVYLIRLPSSFPKVR